MSGYGAGVKNIDVGIGKLYLAYLGGLDDDINAPTSGSFYKHSLDVRLKNIEVGPGKLMIIGIANYEKGNTFTRDFAGNNLVHPVRTSDAYGLGGGAVYRLDLTNILPHFGAGAPWSWQAQSYIDFYGLARFRASNFSHGTHPGPNPGISSNPPIQDPSLPARTLVNSRSA